jgi:putative DNA primase/helicase
VASNDRKTDRVLAALFMVLANRYDWQLFLEVTGPASGKSVMAEICTMLAGKANTVSASMKALEDAREGAGGWLLADHHAGYDPIRWRWCRD